jgi:SAM-dependent methyltransferase
MEELKQYLTLMVQGDLLRMIISNPVSKGAEFKKIVIEKKKEDYQIAKYTAQQVFHEHVAKDRLADRCEALVTAHFKQVNAWTDGEERILLISKKGTCSYKVKKGAAAAEPAEGALEHNRRKNYILQEGTNIAPLVDMGVFTKDGRVINAMYDKYRQINRFLEILDDELTHYRGDTLNVIDFGCGKSYLTFVLYYYLTQIRHLHVQMIGLDLKKDVIAKCNAAARKYGYEGLHFELGDINGFQTPFHVNLVVTLHACDTATDYALYNAVQWNADLIFSVPCCQHELNRQIKGTGLPIMSRYGIIKERFCALSTDAIRGNLLTYAGYKTQLLEFIDFEQTPKNILIRAVRSPMLPGHVREKALKEVQELMEAFDFQPTLYELLVKKKTAEL